MRIEFSPGALCHFRECQVLHAKRKRLFLRCPAFRFFAGLVLSVICFPNSVRSEEPVRERQSFNSGWLFCKGDPDGAKETLEYPKIKDYLLELTRTETKGAPVFIVGDVLKGIKIGTPAWAESSFVDSGWRQLALPHDWGIEGDFQQEYPGITGKLPWWGIAWYRKHFTISKSEEGRRIFLTFDGAMSYSTVWLNGHFAGGRPYGYASYQIDLTPFIHFGGENVLAVRLDNPKDSSRWYPGGGIYRNVWLETTNPVHIAYSGTAITTPEVSEKAATIGCRVDVENQSDKEAGVAISTSIYRSEDGKREQPVATFGSVSGEIAPGARETFSFKGVVNNPALWSLEHPELYTAVTTLKMGAKTVDVSRTEFGIRTVAFDADRGFLLNGEPVKIKGVCMHHDLGALGTAINKRALERQIEILKEMGCNAIRTSHNPPAPELPALCDRMGMLLMLEIFDGWKQSKKANDYGRLFEDWSERDLRAAIRRDRNHPSVVLWSLGNEMRELERKEESIATGARLAGIAKEEDDTRPTTAGSNWGAAGWNGFQKVLDVFGNNYTPELYPRFRAANPDKALLGSETASCVSSRGEYFFPVTDDRAGGRSDFQVSSYDLYSPKWSTTPDAEFAGLDANPNVAGEFVWTGFDYLGEPTPYSSDATNLLNFSDPAAKKQMEGELKALGKIKVPSRSSYFGIVDLAGFKKDRFYLYQSRWRPDLPMAHILPHWNWPERVGQVTPVHVYTSGDEAELFLNGKSLGRKKKAPGEYRLRWDDVVYEPGEVRVIAYKNGKQWAEDFQKTTGGPAKITLKADRSVLDADSRDLGFVTVAVTDKDGVVVPRAKNLLHFQISGPGEIAGIDNGDATSLEPFSKMERKAFNGLALAIVRPMAGASGEIKLRVESEGLTPMEIPISIK